MPKVFDLPQNLDLPTKDASMRRDHASTRQDEQRLFPYYSTRPSPNGVPIVPGETFKKSPGETSKKRNPLQNVKGFRPVDKLSSKGRESGPVRARGMQGNRGGSQTFSRVSIPRPQTQTLLEHDRSERPTKRRRRDNQSSPTQSFIDLSDDNEAQSVNESSSVTGAARLSPGSSQQSLRTPKSKRPKRSNPVDEYRQVERMVMGSQISPKLGAKRFRRGYSPEDELLEECFTELAARERRFSIPSLKHEVLQSVEINTSGGSDRSGSPSLHAHPTNEQRDSESRESPDELQGAATVQPAPDFSREFRKKDVRGGINAGKQVFQSVSSPADIRPTVFSPSHRGQGKPKRRNNRPGTRPSAGRCFQATSVRFGSIIGPSSGNETVELHVDPINEQIKMALPDPANSFQIPFSKVCKITRGTSPSCKVRLALRSEGAGDQSVDINLTSSEDKEDLCSLFAANRVKVVDKDGDWMNKAFKKNENTKTSPRYLNGIKRSSTERAPEQGYEAAVEVPKRPKLSASLQDDHKPNAIAQSGPTDSSSNSRLAQSSRETASNEMTKATSPKAGTEEAVEIPVKKYTGDATPSNRATRSATRRMLPATVVSDGEEENSPRQQCEKISQKWQRPLVYPRFGKKKAEVDGQDLERLRDNEFLNDNLIGFYIRFLEDHLERNNKEVSKRVYFFNSYFFATLTNLPRGKQGINYEGVQKWTRNVDIFSYDYIVVPINEAAHWYVAIICNLPKLRGIANEEGVIEEPAEGSIELSALPKRDDWENPDTPEAVGEISNDKGETETAARSAPNPEKEELARESLAAMSLLDQKEMKDRELEVPASDDEWPEKEENPVFSPAKLSSPARDTEPSKQVNSQDASQSSVTGSQKLRKPKKKRPGPRYEVWQPTIITFDSLNLSRSPTISVLRNYLREEAHSKRGLEIDTTLIKGMKAQEIPLQPNYSDCGLYLLAYVEKFVQDPDTFVTKMLRREMRVEDDWPPLRSGLLRSRLRKFLDDLHDEQEQMSREKAAERTTMADRQPICYLLGCSEDKTDLAAENNGDASATRSEKSPSKNPAPEKSGLEPAQKAKSRETRSAVQRSSRDGTPDSRIKAKRLPPQTLAASASESTSRKEVVEVPDSQEPVQPTEDVTFSSILHVEDSQRGQARSQPQDPKPIEEDAVQIQIPHQSADDSIVEVQVLGTPPPGLSTDKRDGVRKSPRSSRKKA